MKNISGFSLIEVLVSLLLLSLILFGLDAAQIYSIKETQNDYFFYTAQNQLNNAAERLLALKVHNDDLAEQLSEWNMENQAILPQGLGTISGEFPDYVITIYWGDIAHHCVKWQIGKSGCIRKKLHLG